MRLTTVLLRFKKKPPGGNIWRGKYRLWLDVRPSDVKKQIAEYKLEERNLFYLRHPYLTVEEAAALPEEMTYEYRQQVLKKEAEERENFKQHAYLGDRLGFLKIKEGWE